MIYCNDFYIPRNIQEDLTNYTADIKPYQEDLGCDFLSSTTA